MNIDKEEFYKHFPHLKDAASMITPFSRAMRDMRLATGENLRSMATSMRMSIAELSGLECNRKRITPMHLSKIKVYLKSKNYVIENLDDLVDQANNAPLRELPKIEDAFCVIPTPEKEE